MQLIYAFADVCSSALTNLFFSTGSVFNFMAPVIAPVFHAYFDVFAGFIQTLIFVTLTMVLLGNELPEDIKNA